MNECIVAHFYRNAWNADAASDENSVCLSVCLSNAWFVTKRKKAVPAFLYHMKDHLPQFSDKKNGWWSATPLPGILGQPAPVEQIRRFWTDIRS